MKLLQDPEFLKALWQSAQARANIDFILNVFGLDLAERNEWSVGDGREAITLHLVKKHSWLPEKVRQLSDEDLQVVLHDELEGWQMPPAAAAARSK